MLVQILPTKLRKLMAIVGLGYINQVVDSMFLSPTNETEIINIVKSLSENKSPGHESHDEVPLFVLKSIIVSIVTPLVHGFNLSFHHGQFPTTLKLAKV